jgi:ABC-2 type transport system permease protein
VTSRDVTVTATVDGRPVRAGIDPYNILIDRTPGDNVRAVTSR